MAKTTNAKNADKKAEYEVSVRDKDGKKYTATLAEPDRNTVSFALSTRANGKVLEAGAIFFEDCWIEADEEIFKNDKMRMAVELASSDCVKDITAGELKKI